MDKGCLIYIFYVLFSTVLGLFCAKYVGQIELKQFIFIILTFLFFQPLAQFLYEFVKCLFK